MLSPISIAFLVFLMVYLPMSPECGERTISSILLVLIGKQLLFFFNFGFNSLNEFLFICMFRMDYANVLAVNGMIPQNLLRGALENSRVTMDLMFVKG